ncbi:MAG: serine/threonine-protein kinase [Candidatus Sulfopaludibacter sp.]|nr:serine/threonine-protein kinase [Candidatus Sulfopaludibacter sp.]
MNGEGSPATKTIHQPHSSSHPSSSNIDEGRFPPGTVLAQRFRIVSLLGRGGMGEVYRANDLLLGQAVALKFLPSQWTSNEPTLSRFRNEVRIARQISHPNVCRVYDIGEAGGSTYLSMEYVDGEDLASLLRRIGRLPQDKALEIARQLCAGLAAAHDKGVMHRDLKPANIMLDGQGQLRITDFGLAGVAGEIKDLRSGTPAYMAPEQRSGREVTARSDLYALGMVLHEVFTGRSFSADSSHPDLAPEVDRVIRRCLAEDPAKRPASALAVSAALPGGDPLAAALAAGETPSPEMVAAAGDSDSVSVRTIGICAALIVAGLVAVVTLAGKTSLLTKTPFRKSPAVLEQRAQDVIQSLGYTDPPADRVYGFRYDTDYQRYAQKEAKPATYRAQLAKGQPPLIYFWYRQSPQYLEAALEDNTIDIIVSVATPTNPPPNHVGMIGLNLDAQGRLIQFSAVPPQVEETPVSQRPADWTPLLTAAGLEMTRFAPAEPQWIPLVSFDSRAAWTGSYAHAPDVPLRIEAASWRGRPVYFQVIGPWSKPERMQPPRWTAGDSFGTAFFIFTLSLSAFLAWRNIRLGRGDTRGAFRLAAFVLNCQMLVWLCSASHVPTNHEFISFAEAFAVAFASAGRAWMFYVALEPYVRRRLPQIMITWSRLLGGGVRDSLVGGHLLIGAAFGVGFAALGLGLIPLVQQLSGSPSPGPPNLASILDARHMTLALIAAALAAAFSSLLFLLFLFLLRAMLRRLWLAAAALILIIITVFFPTSLFDLCAAAIFAVAIGFILIRFGVMALMAAIFVWAILLFFPLTTDLTTWYASSSLFAIASVLALTAYAGYTALAGRPIFQAGFLDSD